MCWLGIQEEKCPFTIPKWEALTEEQEVASLGNGVCKAVYQENAVMPKIDAHFEASILEKIQEGGYMDRKLKSLIKSSKI